MMNSKIQLMLPIGLIALSAAALLWMNRSDKTQAQYFRNEGTVFGTFYMIQYEDTADCHEEIQLRMKEVDEALSMFNPSSLLSRLNRGEDVLLTPEFEYVWNAAYDVSVLSQGAFDITVAPLVNAWGFGFKNRQQMTSERVDSLRQLVDYRNVQIVDHHLVKCAKDITIDAGAIAKGYGCDRVADLLREKGIHNFLVDIGGEVVAEGKSVKGKEWAIGITKPIDDPTGTVEQLQDIVHTTDVAMASSGNYRNFYYEGAQRRSHTIDPRTGYPVEHSLLSATVVAPTCMRADALATACMVLGADDALRLIDETSDAACYLIVSQGDSLAIVTSSRWPFHP